MPVSWELVSWDLIVSVVDTQTLAVSALLALLIAGFAARKTRAAAIWIAQYAAFVGLVFATLAAAHAGYAIGGAIALANGFNQMGQLYYSVAGAGLGVIAGLDRNSTRLNSSH